jgi:transposase
MRSIKNIGSPSGAETSRQNPQGALHFGVCPQEAVQVDFGKRPTITDAFTAAIISSWIFVMTLCFNRHMCAEIVADQKLSTWLGCHNASLRKFVERGEVSVTLQNK